MQNIEESGIDLVEPVDPVEVYITEHTDAKFTHGICPKCVKEYFSDSADRKKK